VKIKRRKKPSAILAADLHIRADIPRCRTDDFLSTQDKKVRFIVNLSKKYNCPILIAGDIGDKHQWPNWLLRWFIYITKNVSIIAIPGQHDLPGHRLEEIERSAQGVLLIADALTLSIDIDIISVHKGFNIITFPYSKKITHIKVNKKGRRNYPNIAITHQMVIENKLLWPDQKGLKAIQLLKKFPEYDLILSGDNHNSFIVDYKGRLLVNPGSMMRIDADQIDHKPRVYLWYADTNIVKPIYLPIEDNVITREHIDKKIDSDKRVRVYVRRMKKEYGLTLSFEKNMERHIEKNNVGKKVERRIWEMVI